MSTDEQAERKHSLAYQEYKLRRHCLHNGIEVVGFYKEDHSAKSFDRPAFSKMLEFLRKNKGAANTLLFMMWDRFSRNTSEAYAMISMRSKLGVEPQALEQQLNLEVPKQKIMLALYRTTPEAENDRRSMNIHAGLRRAKKEGRYMGPLPAGYRSSRNEKNKPCLVPGEHADLVRESFEKMATGQYHIGQLRQEMHKRGLRLSRNAFWAMLRSNVYIGKITVPAYRDEEEMTVDGSHEPLVTADLFYQVPHALSGRRAKNRPAKVAVKAELQLRGFVQCSHRGGKYTGSGSNGNGGRYFYYHCRNGCPERSEPMPRISNSTSY